MDSIIFLIALICVIYVVVWAIRNEDIEDDQPTEGFFRMTHDIDDVGTSGKPGDASDEN